MKIQCNVKLSFHFAVINFVTKISGLLKDKKHLNKAIDKEKSILYSWVSVSWH